MYCEVHKYFHINSTYNTFCCLLAFDGRFCEEDRDGCTEITCFAEVECFDVPAPGVGAMCGPCPMGFQDDNDTRCAGTFHIRL